MYYTFGPIDMLYLFMVWVALQVLTTAFDQEKKIHWTFKILFPLVTTLIIFILMTITYHIRWR